jgi:hypothetical protein
MRRRPLTPAVVATVLVVLAVVAQLLRQRGTPAWDVVQSDDGYGFLVPVWTNDVVPLLWRSYAGYLQVVPRLVATPLAALPASWGAAYLTVTSAVITVLLGWFVALAARGLVRQAWLRWALALTVIFLPGAGWETTGVLSEQQFVLVLAAFWAVISVQRSRPMLVARVGVVVLAVTSAPLALLFLPLAAAIVWWRRDRTDAIVAVALVIGSILQGIAMLVSSGPPPIGPRTLRGVLSIYLQRVVASWAVGDTQLDDAWRDLGTPLLVFATALAVAIIAVLAATVARRQWIWAGAAFTWSGFALAVSLWSRGITEQLPVQEGSFSYAGARYVLVPLWLFISGLVLLAGGPPREDSPVWLGRTATIARYALVAQLAVMAVVGFRVDSLRSPGPSFASELRAVRAECREGPGRSAVMRFAPPSFYATVPCDAM